MFFTLSIVGYGPFSTIGQVHKGDVFTLYLLSNTKVFCSFICHYVLYFSCISSARRPTTGELAPVVYATVFTLFSTTFFVTLKVSFGAAQCRVDDL